MPPTMHQVAIYVTSIAIYENAVGIGQGAHAASQYVAGLSLGEYTALHIAGVLLTFLDGLTLVKARGQLMQAAAEVRCSSTMLAVLGADEDRRSMKICTEAAEAGIIVPANFNTPGQIVLSGSVPACQKAAQIAEARGFKSIPLQVAGAFHSPFMESAAEQMAQVLENIRFSPARIPVISHNVTAAQPHGDSEDRSANCWCSKSSRRFAGIKASNISAPKASTTGWKSAPGAASLV